MASLVTTLPRLLQFERMCLEKIWGGRTLVKWLGIAADSETRVGETWEVYDRESSSVVRGGRLAGATLRDLMTDHGTALLGSAAPDRFGRFPLLLKLLDAEDQLSLQVHPCAELAESLGLADGEKNEAWVVLTREPGARLVRGLRAGAAVDDLMAALRAGTDPRPFLHEFTVEPGDVIAIPAGTLHCIGAGIQLYEIQQNSDVTFRLCDWGRVGDDGRPRELHLDGAGRALRAVADVTAEPRPDGDGMEVLVESPAFELRRVRFDRRRTLATGGFCHLLTAVDEALRVRSGDESLVLERGDTCMCPASTARIDVEPAATGRAGVGLWVHPN